MIDDILIAVSEGRSAVPIAVSPAQASMVVDHRQ
jgi:hypothetical protein